MEIFGRGSDWLVLITAPERYLQLWEETIDPVSMPVGDIWLKTNVCSRSLVGARVGLGYLVGVDAS